MNINEIIRHAAVIVDQEIKGKYRLFLFGSRVKENHNERSDIDIGILAETPISTRQLMVIQQKIEQIPTLLKIDFLDFNSIDEEFKQTALKHTREIKI